MFVCQRSSLGWRYDLDSNICTISHTNLGKIFYRLLLLSWKCYIILQSAWDLARTAQLMEERRRVILANLESRIKTSAEREFYARNLIRKELVEKANNGDVEGIKVILTEVAEEAAKSGGKPRATVDVRNDSGQSLLSIAAQHDYVDLAQWLLTYYKDLDKDRWDLAEGEISTEAKIFKPNVNSRDLKGWTCVCIAVFHDSRKVLKLLLENGGDPNIRSSYNKNAWDLAKVGIFSFAMLCCRGCDNFFLSVWVVSHAVSHPCTAKNVYFCCFYSLLYN